MPGRGLRALLTVFALALLAGCALWRAPDEVALPGGGSWRLLGPGALGQSLSALQRVDAEFGEHQATLLFYLEAEPLNLALLATTPEGLELFKLELREGEPRLSATRSPLAPKPLQPAQVLADLQLVYWPATALRAELTLHGFTLVERGEGSGWVRELRRGDEVLVAIHYDAADPWSAGVRFEQRAWGYRYAVTTLELNRP